MVRILYYFYEISIEISFTYPLPVVPEADLQALFLNVTILNKENTRRNEERYKIEIDYTWKFVLTFSIFLCF